MMKSKSWWLIVAALSILVVGALYYWSQRPKEAPLPAPEPPRTEAPAAPAAPAEPQIRHPIEQAQVEQQEQAQLPALDDSDKLVTDTLVGLLGSDAVQEFLNVNGFIRRAVATVDNLPRKKAVVRLWPVQPTTGRFMVSGADNNASINPDNYRRYAAFIRFVERTDTAKLVAFYVRAYPLFQRAYEELGFPGRYFNDRLVEVIDHLLATPETSGPVKLAKPWIMYEFADPELEARSAGQKILLRMGNDNAARLKAKLRDIRRQVTRVPAQQ